MLCSVIEHGMISIRFQTAQKNSTSLPFVLFMAVCKLNDHLSKKFLFFPSKLRSKQARKVLMHLCFALIAWLIVFLAGFGAKNQQQCQVFSVLTHHFVLASFFWMAVEAVNVYLCVVRIMDSKMGESLCYTFIVH